MDLRSTLGQIPFQGVAPGDLFADYRRGNSSFDDWVTMEAIRSLECEAHIKPIPFPLMPDAARTYAIARRDGRIPYDQPSAKRLGDWFYLVTKLSEHRKERIEHFSWCAEKCQIKDLTDLVDRAQEAVNRWTRAEPPISDMELALRVKDMDANARSRG